MTTLVSVLVVIIGLILLAIQIPRKAAISPLRFSDSESVLMVTVVPEVLPQALPERAEDVPGVEQCAVWITGSPSSLWVQVDVTVPQDCGVVWAMAKLREQLEDDVATPLGMRPGRSTFQWGWSTPRASATSHRLSWGSTRPRPLGTAMVCETRGEATVAPRPHPDHTTQPSASSGVPPDKDRCLVLRTRDGNISAFEQFVERYQGRLFRIAYMIMHNRHDSGDIVQDTLIQAWRGPHLVRGPVTFQDWLIWTCANKATSMARKRQRRVTNVYDAEGLETASVIAETTPSSTVDPAESSEVNAQIEALADLLASVQLGLRIVWAPQEIDDMSYGGVAQTLDLIESTVRGRLVCARSLVIRQMKE